MARTGYDFQSPDMKNAIGKEARAMSKEIIQFDQAMFETRLDAMVRDKVEQIVNAMLDEEADLIANAARYERSDGRKTSGTTTGPATTRAGSPSRPAGSDSRCPSSRAPCSSRR